MMMILLIYGGPLVGLPRIDVVSMLGGFAAPNKQDAVTLGGAIHFTMGVVFAIVYAGLWSLGIGSPTLVWGCIFGCIHGLFIIFFLLLIARQHPLLSAEHFTEPRVMLAVILNHVIYGMVVAFVYST
jgi:cytochrome c biogenesis protein CcdA